MPENLYELLGVDRDATQAELKQAYRARAREYHPDVNDDYRAGAQFKTVRRSFDVLSDEAERKDYDRLGHHTYVKKRMKGFPTATPSAGSDSRSNSDSGSRSASKRTESARSTTGSSGSSARSSSQSAPDGTSQSKWAGTSSTSNASRTTRTAGTSTGRSSARSHGSTGGSSTGEATAGGTTAAGQTRRAYRRTESTETTEPTTPNANPRRRALRTRWLAVFVAAAVYVAGLAVYLVAGRSALATYLAGLTADPTTAASSVASLPNLVAFVRAAVATPGPALVLPVGTALLPVVLGVTVVQYGQGRVTWLYVLGTLGPLAAIAAATTSVPTAFSLLLLVVLPVVGAGGFLADVGRYLVRTRN